MMFRPSKHNINGIIFRNFCMLDMYEALYVRDCIDNDLFVPKIDLRSALANFNG